MKYCGNCGKQVKDDARFCPSCGRAFRCLPEVTGNANRGIERCTSVALTEFVRKNHAVVLAVLALFLIALVVGCFVNARPENALIGTWYLENDKDEAIRFYQDGTCDIAGGYDEYIWSVSKDRLRISSRFSGTVTYDIVYLVGDKLILCIGDETVTLDKK